VGLADPVGVEAGVVVGAAPAPTAGLAGGAGAVLSGTVAPVAGPALGAVLLGGGLDAALGVPVGRATPEDVTGGVADLVAGAGAARGIETGGVEPGVASRVDAAVGGAGVTAGGLVGAGPGRAAAGGAPFSMRVRSLAVLCWGADAVWSAARAERIRTLDMVEASRLSP
jgi:hypothetical protein